MHTACSLAYSDEASLAYAGAQDRIQRTDVHGRDAAEIPGIKTAALKSADWPMTAAR